MQCVSVHRHTVQWSPSRHNLESSPSFLEWRCLCLTLIFKRKTEQHNQELVSAYRACVCVCACLCAFSVSTFVCNTTLQFDPLQVQLNSPYPYLHYSQIFAVLQFHTQIIYSRWFQVNYFKCLTGTLNNWEVDIFTFPILICLSTNGCLCSQVEAIASFLIIPVQAVYRHDMTVPNTMCVCCFLSQFEL